ncbi:SnoaL-like domain-containing protein [Paraburkholderia susongensis]|uniref:SnoaL-like domain-containing protein n=2 Tax=Paraburkholderia susongensis TaxID=1515439 RepID=A0A1X7LQP0_9BURK|nr:nuclear transport factor 2 family protein [Paraburkholderia susongensis]SMG56226.1 SnoaL-like domain-containing protein [Paraburkholderia susongensis]
MENESLLKELQALKESVRELRAEADIRRIMARYMLLCDIPLPEQGLDMAGRISEIVGLFSKDACWEGVGVYYDNQFGASFGHEQIARHFERFFQPKDPAMIFNCHYLTCEQIHVHGDTADGQWVHFQPWIFDDGSSVLRSSRLNNMFRCVDEVWKIARYRSENLFAAPLPSNWATNVPATSVLMKP